MSVVLNEPGLVAFLDSEAGPVGLMLAARGVQVAEKARENASGPIIDIRSGALHSGIESHVEAGVEGLQAVIGSGATNEGFPYPAIVTRKDGVPGGWLTQALQEVFG